MNNFNNNKYNKLFVNVLIPDFVFLFYISLKFVARHVIIKCKSLKFCGILNFIV